MRLARCDLLRRAELRGRIPRQRRRCGRGGELHRAAEFEHHEARDVGHFARHAARDPGDERKGAVLAGLESDILHSADAEGRWRADDPRLHVEVEELLAGVGGIGAEAPGARSLEDQIACRGHRAAIPCRGIIDAPGDLAGARIEGDEASGGRGDGGAEGGLVVGQHPCGQRGADVEAEHLAPVELVHVLDIALRNLLRGNIDEARGRVVAHRVPVVRAKRARDRDEGLAGLVEARVGIFDRPAGGHVIAGRPVDPVDERLGVDQLSGRAVDREEKAVLRCMIQHFGRRAVHRLLGKDDRLRRGIVPALARRFLIMPFIFAG